MRYSRDVPRGAAVGAVQWTEDHVRAHLSACCTPDDNPYTLAAQVRLSRREVGGLLRITGELDAEPVAPYLRDDWRPEHDVRANPLTVESIEDQ